MIGAMSQHPLIQKLHEKSNQSNQPQGILNPNSENHEHQAKPVVPSYNNPAQNQNQSQPDQQDGNYLFPGHRVKDIGSKIRNHPFLQTRDESKFQNQHQEFSTPQPTTPRIFEPHVQQPQNVEGKWYRCPMCQRNFEGKQISCPYCNQPVPEYVYAKGTRNSNISLD